MSCFYFLLCLEKQIVKPKYKILVLNKWLKYIKQFCILLKTFLLSKPIENIENNILHNVKPLEHGLGIALQLQQFN